MTTTKEKAHIGTLIEATHLNSDLLPAFADELERLGGDAELVAEARDVDPDRPAASEIVNELMDALNEYAPVFCYFGAHEGDGADFGFWPARDAIAEAQTFAKVRGTYRDGEFVYIDRHDREGDYVFADEDNVWVHTNDHGNLTVYANAAGPYHARGRPGDELWSIV